MEEYRYKRLPKPIDSLGGFRLATLWRGSMTDPICLTIATYSLDALVNPSEATNSIPANWGALSYVWGSSTGQHERVYICDAPRDGDQIQSGENLRYLSVTKGLTDALRHIRDVHTARTLWIDAICIDEGTAVDAMNERAWQVQSMHHIYANATGVIVWLGLEADDSAFALHSLQDLGSSIHVDWTTFEIYTPDGVPSNAMVRWDDPAQSTRDRKAVGDLLARPWFERVWVRQEAFFAKEDSSGIFCGSAQASFATVRRAIHYLWHVGLNTVQRQNRLALAMSVFERSYSDLPGHLRRIRLGKCLDDRDRVYAVLHMANNHQAIDRRIAFPVDYSETNTVAKVYRELFVRFTETYDTLRLLDEAGLWQKPRDVPTWVPDWRCAVVEHQLDLSMESATSHFLIAEATHVADTTLRVLGRVAGETSKTISLHCDSEHRYASVWERLACLLSEEMSLAEEDDRVERLTRALCCVLNSIRTGLADMEQRREEIKEYIRYLSRGGTGEPVSPPEDILPERATWALNQCVTFLQTRNTQLLFFAQQYVGIGPQCAAPGDLLYAILGSRVLMLLRKTAAGTHQVVGPCFVHGFNWGEALLGPFPNGVTVKPYFEASRKGYVPQYVNAHRGTSSMWDPRVAWEELEAHPPMVNFVPIAAPSGSPFRIRPDSSYLKRHGVEVEELNLV